MDDPQLAFRRLRDKFIQVLLSPLFESVPASQQQEWFRDMTVKLNMEPLQFNGFLRQVWNKASLAPQLIELPVTAPTSMLPSPPIIGTPAPPMVTSPIRIPPTTTIQPLIPFGPGTQIDTPLSPTGYRKFPSFKPSPPMPPPGPPPADVWADKLVKIINGDIFSTVPIYQRLEYLLREYKRGLEIGAIGNVAQFNELLVKKWSSNAPEIPQLTNDLQYGSVKNIFYKVPSPFRSDVTYVGDKEFVNLGRVRDQVFGFFKAVQERLVKERQKYHKETGEARGWPFESELLELINDMNLVVRELWYPEGDLFSRQIPLTEYIGTMQSWTDRYNDILKELGKRHCINSHDPFDGTPVEEIPDGEYIRLANGVCWHIMSLVEYIRGVNGRNSSQGLSKYPTRELWNKEIDFPRILRHPLVKKTDFAAWYKEKTSPKAIAEQISVETLNRMERAGGLLRSVGPDFERELRARLTPEQMAIFQQQASGDPDVLNRIRDSNMRAEIVRIIKEDLKSLAMMEFMIYWDQLPPEEREAVLVFNVKLEENLRRCLVNDFCVFGMGNDFLVTRNEIAVSKKIPAKDYGVSFE